jgi:hypothetical protein
MHGTTSSEQGGCIRDTKVRDKHIFKEDQVRNLEERYHRNRIPAKTFGILEDDKIYSERNKLSGWLLRR